MMLLDVPQGRALAIVLSFVTLSGHIATFFVLQALFEGAWNTSYLAWYDLVAAAASAVGVYGAVKRRSNLFSMYALVHATTLMMITAVFFVNILPPSLPRAIPVLNYVRYDVQLEQWMCYELDDGFGWDAQWFENCKASFWMLATGLAWTGSILMAAQWWALVCVCRWNTEKKSRRRERRGDVEKGGLPGEKHV